MGTITKILLFTLTALLVLAGCTKGPSPNLCPTVCDGLVAYYPFYGDATDKSGNGHNGKVTGATLTKDRNGYQNHAYRLDGIDDYLQLENFPSSSSFTISVLVKINKASSNWVKGMEHSWGTILYSEDERSFWLGYTFNKNGDNNLYFSVHQGSGEWSNAEKKNQNEINPLGYNLYTGVADTNNQKILLYVNGKLLEKDEWDGTFFGKTIKATLGVRNPNWESQKRGNLDGIIDEVRLYNRALSADEVKELYLFTSAFPPAE